MTAVGWAIAIGALLVVALTLFIEYTTARVERDEDKR